MGRQLASSHNTLAQTDRQLSIHRHRRLLQGQFQPQQDGSIFLSIEPQPHMSLSRLALASGKHHKHAIIIRQEPTFGRLVEEVHTHRSGELLLQIGINTVVFPQMELLAKETLVFRRHVLVHIVLNPLTLSHNLRTERMISGRDKALGKVQILLQGHQLVIVSHSLLLATTDKRIDGCCGETRSIVARRIDPHVQIGHGNVLLELVLAVYIDDLIQDAKRALNLVGSFRVALNSNANDDVCPHFLGKVGRIVVLHAAIGKHHIA